MNFEKKVLVLKQTTGGFSISDRAVSGIARFEADGGVVTFHLSLINLSALDGGGYAVAISLPDNPILIFDLGVRPLSFNTVLENLTYAQSPTVALIFIKDDIPVVIAYASDCATPLSEFKKALAEKCLTDRKKRQSAKQEKEKLSAECAPPPNADKPTTPVVDKPAIPAVNTVRSPKSDEISEPKLCAPPTLYDDEAIATENYFEKDLSLQEKLKYIEKVDDEYLRNENARAFSEREKEACQNAKIANILQDEKFANDGETYSGKNTFFSAKRAEIEGILSSHAPEPALAKIIPESQWVRIEYAENKHYVVGLIKENGTEKYICYGVPSKYSVYPPSELALYCSFIPLSVFDLQGDGYWMLFQDAISGESVKFNRK